VSDQPNPPLLILAFSIGAAIVAWLSHKGVGMLRSGAILGDHSFRNLDRAADGHWLFKNRANWLFVQRSMLTALLLCFKYALGFVAALTAVVACSDILVTLIKSSGQ